MCYEFKGKLKKDIFIDQEYGNEWVNGSKIGFFYSRGGKLIKFFVDRIYKNYMYNYQFIEF